MAQFIVNGATFAAHKWHQLECSASTHLIPITLICAFTRIHLNILAALKLDVSCHFVGIFFVYNNILIRITLQPKSNIVHHLNLLIQWLDGLNLLNGFNEISRVKKRSFEFVSLQLHHLAFSSIFTLDIQYRKAILTMEYRALCIASW